MSFLKKLFGGGGASDAAGATLEHNGFLIRATPFKEAGQWQLCGVISKEINGETKHHRFVRADRSSNAEEITQMTLDKGRLIVEQQGEAMFR
jgi:hypothetical protein